MIATQLYDAGYRDLVCVIPPDGEIAPTSKVDPSQRGKCPGKFGQHGWYGYAFQGEYAPDRADVEKWEQWGANIGLHGLRFPALDADVRNEKLAEIVLRIADKLLGPGPVRIGQPPKVLRPYRTTEPFSRMAAVITYKGESHTVEVLGRGRQYLVYGTHPSGREYTWDTPLWEVDPDKLALINPEKVRAFFEALKVALEKKGIEVELIGDVRSKEEKSPPQEDLLAPNLDALREVVEQIPNTSDLFPERDDYIRFGHAVKAAGAEDPEQAYEIFEEWAMRWEGDAKNPDGNDLNVVRHDWDRMHSPFRVGWQWLLEQLPERAQAAAEEFAADPVAVLPASPAPLPKADSRVTEHTDLWVVEHVRVRVLDRLRYAPETGFWHVWTGSQWKRDTLLRHRHEIQEAMLQLARQAMDRAAVAPSDAESKEQVKLAAKLQGRDLLTKMPVLLQSHPSLVVRAEDFDPDPWILNTPDFMIDLRTGVRSASTPEAMCAKQTGCSPAPGDAPMWFEYLQRTTGGDRALMRFLQKAMGYALTGITREQNLQFFHGGSDTGKSCFVKTMRLLYGEYHENAPMEAFTASRNDRIPADIAKLVGARLVTANETQSGRHWDEARIKAITSGDAIDARFLHKNWFTFVPTFKIVIVGNHEPQIENADDAMRKRVHIVPFNVKIPREEQIDGLHQKMFEQEGPQILHWLIEGCLLWQAEKLNPPESVLARTDQYFEEEDLIQQWLDDSCVISNEGEALGLELYRSWEQWCNARGEFVGTRTRFTRALNKKQHLGFTYNMIGPKGKRVRGYQGIALLDVQEGPNEND